MVPSGPRPLEAIARAVAAIAPMPPGEAALLVRAAQALGLQPEFASADVEPSRRGLRLAKSWPAELAQDSGVA